MLISFFSSHAPWAYSHACLNKSCREAFKAVINFSSSLALARQSNACVTKIEERETSTFQWSLTSAECEKFRGGQLFSANELVDCPRVSQRPPVSRLYRPCCCSQHFSSVKSQCLSWRSATSGVWKLLTISLKLVLTSIISSGDH